MQTEIKSDKKKVVVVFAMWILACVLLGIMICIFLTTSILVKILILVAIGLWKILEKMWNWAYRHKI